MAKVKIYDTDEGRQEAWFWCPGCKANHRFIISGDASKYPVWKFNGDVNNPTFEPSLRITYGNNRQCHLHLENGIIRYVNDGESHELNGMSVECPEYED